MGDTARWAPLVLLLAAVAFWAYSLADFSRTPEREMRSYPRTVWLVILTFGSVLGSLAWWLIGRPPTRHE